MVLHTCACRPGGVGGGSSYKEGWLWWDDISMHSDNTSLAGPSKLEVKNIWNARAMTCPQLLHMEFISAVFKRKPDGKNGAWNSWKPHYVLWDGSKKSEAVALSGGGVGVAWSEGTTFAKLHVRAKVRICGVRAREVLPRRWTTSCARSFCLVYQ